MASTVKFEMEVELKSPADAMWNTIKDINFLYPKLFPEVYESIEILEGDGRSAGTILLVTNVDGAGFGKRYKTKIESLDEDNKTETYRALEGDILKFYKFFSETIAVRAEDKGSMLFWSCTYEKAIDVAPDGEMFRDSTVRVYHKLDAYTLSKIKN